MLLTREESLSNFDFWGSAADNAAVLTMEQMDELEDILTNEHPNGMDETELNDLFRYDEDYLAQLLDFDDFDALKRANGVDDDDD